MRWVWLFLIVGCGGGRVREPVSGRCEGWKMAAVGGAKAEGVPAGWRGAEIESVGVRGDVGGRAGMVPAELVLAAVQVKAGDVVDRGAIAEDLRRVWGMEAFDDVGVELVEERGGVGLVWVVVERAVIGRVMVFGPGARRLKALAGGLH